MSSPTTTEQLESLVIRLQSQIMGLEQDRLADACQVDRMAIQIQILRVNQAQLLKRVAELEAHQC